MWSIGVSVDAELIDGRIAEIEALCEHIIELKNELQNITDGSSEGLYYSKYIESIGQIHTAMDSSEKVMRGYINFMNYAKTNYMTMSSDLASAISNL